MNDSEAVDLSALAPEAARWESIVAQTAQRVDAVMTARAESDSDPLYLIASWRRSLYAAAAVILVALIPAEIALEAREERAEAIHRLAVLSAASAQRTATPTAAEILRTIADETWQ